MKTTTIYLAGPMRGIPEYNFPAFMAAAKRLRDYGFIVFNPAERDVKMGFDPKKDTAKDLSHYMEVDLPEVCRADVLALLPGWEKSEGANIEVYVARKLGKQIVEADTLSPPIVSQVIRQPESVCAEADRIVGNERGSNYGHPHTDYKRTVGAFNALTGHNLSIFDGITFMLCVKLSRQQHRQKRDNIVDLCGYAKCMDMAIAKQKKLDEGKPASDQSQPVAG